MDDKRLQEIESQLNIHAGNMTWSVEIIKELLSEIRELKAGKTV
ncbi:hypothetical protein [Paenibacillus ehimensis]|uniref:Uncharacterized protein n=1 Tax=Paenibacillus ehimensis TaxID=79264 RepID=A0ABT8VI87_9BACL|nr:hypothetical protein [Paenibacillus ehimensis]MDO3680676.1 hypothetical protein [Paenibacillus ehimensis]